MRSSKGSIPQVHLHPKSPAEKTSPNGSSPITTLLFGSIGGTEDRFDLIGDFSPLLNRH